MSAGQSLRSWSQGQRISEATANRRFHAGQLTDDHGRPVHAIQDPITRRITVYPDGPPEPPNPLAGVDPHALAAHMEQAGYVLLTLDEATSLGVDRRRSLVAASS